MVCCVQGGFAQKLKPGLPGMSPSKWITLRHSQAPGRIYHYSGYGPKSYTQEDLFLKAWIPVVNGKKLTLMLGPQYRMEQLEMQSDGENPLHQLANWNLRSFGVDIRSCLKVDSLAWIVTNLNISQSGNLRSGSHTNVPVNYTISALYLKRNSVREEIGYGLMVNRSFNSITVLPVFMYNYNYSSRGGIEISLPYKIAWRNNLSPTDLLYVKAEAMTRAYWINGGAEAYAFRRTELDMGVAYNKQFSRLIGAEIFAGYRRNINTRLPHEVTAVRSSGFIFNVELYFKSPFK